MSEIAPNTTENTVTNWTRRQRMLLAGGAALCTTVIIACTGDNGGGGHEEKPKPPEGGTHVTVLDGSDYFNTPGGQRCGESGNIAHDVKVDKTSGGFYGFLVTEKRGNMPAGCKTDPDGDHYAWVNKTNIRTH